MALVKQQMQVVAVANQKGGVAKTTTVASLGSALAELGQRVLLVDLDPQACLTFSLGFDPGPLLPELPGQQQAGAVSQAKSVTVAGRRYQASSEPGDETPHYYPGGTVAGRPVPRGG